MFDAHDLGDVPNRVNALRARYSLSDSRAAEIQAVRRGDFEAIAPDLFSDQFKRPVVANMIDTAARDMAAMLAPLPAFNCSAASMLSEKAKKFADTRTKIARHYVESSDLELQMADRGADNYNSYGMLVACVEPDFENKTPYIRIESSIGAYPVWNDRGDTIEFARVYYRDWFSIEAEYPHLAGLKRDYPMGVLSNNQVECIKYVSAKRCLTYLPQMGNCPLEDIPNPIGKCYYHVAKRPNAEEGAIKGAYDDVVWVQLARHRIQMLLMEGIDKSVRAPIVVPPDVDDLSLGPDGIIHTAGGAGSVGRARLDMPSQAFGAVDQLKSEIQIGSMSPEARSGSTDASQITGRGLQELAAGYSSQISVGQTVIKSLFKKLIAIAFKMDEKLFGSTEKEVRGNDSGVPYSIKYTPTKDIDGDYSIDITYGFAAGVGDPNRALVFLLQADGAGLLSKDYVRRALPVDLNAAEEERKIVVEQSRQSIILAFSALAQSIPQMAASGMDPTPVIMQQAMFITLLQKGLTVEEAATKALAPPPPPPGAPVDPGAANPGDPSAPGGAPAGFDDQTGLPGGLQSGTATEGPQGRPDLQQLFAGLSSSGSPQLSGGVSRMNPVVNG